MNYLINSSGVIVSMKQVESDIGKDLIIPAEINGIKVTEIADLNNNEINCRNFGFESRIKVGGKSFCRINATGTADLRNADYSFDHKGSLNLCILANKIYLPENQEIRRPLHCVFNCKLMVYPGTLKIISNNRLSSKNYSLSVYCTKLVFKNRLDKSFEKGNALIIGTISEVIYESGIKKIYGNYGDIKLDKVVIPPTVEEICAWAFAHTELKIWPRINFKKTRVLDYCFSYCNFKNQNIDLTGLKVIPGHFINASRPFVAPDDKPNYITLDKEVRFIGVSAFACTHSGNLSRYFFKPPCGKKSVGLNDAKIKENAFTRCEFNNLLLNDCNYSKNSFIMCIVDNLFIDSSKTKSYHFQADVFYACRIGNLVGGNIIPAYMFFECYFKTTDFSETEYIDRNAFYSCRFFNAINLQKIRAIGPYAFNDSTFPNIVFGNTLLEIWDFAFNNVKKSDESPVIIPSAVAAIREDTFSFKIVYSPFTEWLTKEV